MAVLPALLDLLAPSACLACGAPGRDLCSACRRGVTSIGADGCPRCAQPGCRGGRRCPGLGRPWSRAWSAVAYAGPPAALVVAVKQHRRTRAVDVMAAAVAAGRAGWLADGAVLVPAPTAAGRTAERGLDHAALLARAVGARTGARVQACLRRTGRDGGAQHGLDRRTRLAEGRLGIEATGAVPARCVVLDDVHTTGATLAACARALLDRGAQQVVVVTYARSVRS